MSTEFRILYNDYVDYKNKEYHSLMLIRELDKYSVEVISKTKSHGRIYLESKQDAQRLYDMLLKKIKQVGSFSDACTMLEMLKKTKTLRNAAFILKVYGRKLNQDQIGRLMSMFDFRVKSKIKQDDSMVINMFFGSLKFGTFTGTFLKHDFVFEKA